jgi:hypothetical protein
MSDTAGSAAPQPVTAASRHTLSVREVEAMLATAGVPRSHRHVLRLCQSSMLDAVKIPGPSGDEWFVAPSSVPRAIGDLQQIDARRARRGAPRPGASDGQAGKTSSLFNDDIARHDMAQPAVSEADSADTERETRPDTSRRGTTHEDVYEHPYVKRLEDRCEKLEAKLDAQVRRTEEIQIRSQEKLLELQRMTAVGQSQTLAEFMLRAKDLILGRSTDADKEQPNESSTS